MPNEMPLTTQMNALIAYANGITGGSDVKLGDAVHTLADGYCGGLTGMVVDITGACEIDVSSLGDYGVGYRISPVDGNKPIACSWNPTASNAFAYYRSTNNVATNTYANYWKYDAASHKFIYSGSTSETYNFRGKWMFIGANI